MLKLGNNVPGTLESNKKIAEHLMLISMGLAVLKDYVPRERIAEPRGKLCKICVEPGTLPPSPAALAWYAFF